MRGKNTINTETIQINRKYTTFKVGYKKKQGENTCFLFKNMDSIKLLSYLHPLGVFAQ